MAYRKRRQKLGSMWSSRPPSSRPPSIFDFPFKGTADESIWGSKFSEAKNSLVKKAMGKSKSESLARKESYQTFSDARINSRLHEISFEINEIKSTWPTLQSSIRPKVDLVLANYPVDTRAQLYLDMLNKKHNEIHARSFTGLIKKKGFFESDQEFQERLFLKKLEAAGYNIEDYRRGKGMFREEIDHECDRYIKEMAGMIADLTFPMDKEYYRKMLLDGERDCLKEIRKTRNEKRRKARKARFNSFDKKARTGSQGIKQDLKAQLESYPFCPYCEKEITNERDCVADHIHPIAKGGLTIDENMVLICKNCNSKKRDHLLRPFCKDQGFDYMAVVERLERLGKDI